MSIETQEPTRLGLADLAGSALEGEDGQGSFEETESTKVKFVGMAFDDFDQKPIKIGDEMVFTVKARCVGVGDEAMHDGHVRHVVKMDVQSVILSD